MTPEDDLHLAHLSSEDLHEVAKSLLQRATQGDATASLIAKAIESVVVQIGGVNAQVLFAGDAPGFVGLSQINVKVPQGVTPALYLPVSMIVAGNISSQRVTISIK